MLFVRTNFKFGTRVYHIRINDTVISVIQAFASVRYALKKKRDYLGIFSSMGGGVFGIPKTKK